MARAGGVVAAAVAALVLAAPAQAARVGVVVVPPFALDEQAGRGAVGLMSPGTGTSVSREGALAALVRGRTEKSLLGGTPGGPPLIELGRGPSEVTILVSLPPPGTHANDVRYPLAVVGGGYHGILESPSTRIPGLVSIADIAPTALALAEGGRPRIGWTDGGPADLRDLEARLSGQAGARDAAFGILAAAAIAFALAALLTRSRRAGLAGVLTMPVTLAVAVALSAVGFDRPAIVVPLLALLALGISAAAGVLVGSRQAAVLLAALVAAYLVVLVAAPTWPALAAIGPNPGEGGRFYGSTNMTTSIVLLACLFAGSTLGVRGLVPVAALSLVAVGWSRAGADGGGVVVIAAACVALGLRLATGRLTARSVALAGAAAAALGLVLVGLDAATGGSSHVTRRVGDGPGAVLSELADRLHISAERITSSRGAAAVLAVSLAALAVLASRRPRFAGGEALLVGIAVSLLVNDTPQHVAAVGAVSYGAWWAHERTRLAEPRPPSKLDARMRRLVVTLAAASFALGTLAACGYEGQTTASPETVEGSVPQPTETTPTVEVPEGDAVAGKTVFTANCSACHTLADAGASGSVGPNLDQTAPDAALTYDRVVNGKGGMPSFKGSLSDQQLADVTAYVSTAAGS